MVSGRAMRLRSTVLSVKDSWVRMMSTMWRTRSRTRPAVPSSVSCLRGQVPHQGEQEGPHLPALFVVLEPANPVAVVRADEVRHPGEAPHQLALLEPLVQACPRPLRRC